VFGASIAREFTRLGWGVTLIEQYAPGHVRSSSGGDSRLIRCAHGNDPFYTESARRARSAWRQLEQEENVELLLECGVAWLAHSADGWEITSERMLRAAQIPVEHLSAGEAASLFPSLATDDVEFVLLEPEAGVLRAAPAVRALARSAVRGGAELRLGRATPVGAEVAFDGERLGADVVVWAAGPWLSQLFPEHIQLEVTHQDEFYFGVAPTWEVPRVPAFVDQESCAYGHGDIDGRGLKISPDTEGERFDPDFSERRISETNFKLARSYLAHRFPALAEMPLVYTRTCQYELTADGNFILAPHPDHSNLWLLGGGSGHGFKHGPAFAEYAASVIRGNSPVDSRFALGSRPLRDNRRAGGKLLPS